MTTIDQQFVEYIVKSLVNRPEAVIVERRIDEKGVLLELTVDPEDLGRVIGKRGATAQSVRTLLRALGTKNDARYNLKIVDNDDHSLATNSNDDTQAAKPLTDDSADDSGKPVDDVTEKPVDEDDDNEDSMVNRTRKELAELDDLRL